MTTPVNWKQKFFKEVPAKDESGNVLESNRMNVFILPQKKSTTEALRDLREQVNKKQNDKLRKG